VTLPPLGAAQRAALRAALGPKVALANPLDYHTYVWGDTDAMTDTFAAMLAGDVDIGLLVVDFPRPDRCDPGAWDCVIVAGELARARAGKPLALVATLPEAMPEAVALRIVERGLVPLCGLDDALAAVAAAAMPGSAKSPADPILLPGAPENLSVLTEAGAKAALAAHGLEVPAAELAHTADEAAHAAERLGFPVVLKGTGAAHKTEAGLVALDLAGADAVRTAATAMASPPYLVERMIGGALAELLVGVRRDPAHGFVLTLAAGGVLTEILRDSVSLILPVTAAEVGAALDRLRIAPLLRGYRCRRPADRDAILRAVMALQDYVTAHAERLDEAEINPLICTAAQAVAADALIRIGDGP